MCTQRRIYVHVLCRVQLIMVKREMSCKWHVSRESNARSVGGFCYKVAEIGIKGSPLSQWRRHPFWFRGALVSLVCHFLHAAKRPRLALCAPVDLLNRKFCASLLKIKIHHTGFLGIVFDVLSSSALFAFNEIDVDVLLFFHEKKIQLITYQ